MATNSANEDEVKGPHPVLLPLERYAKKQAAALKNYSDKLTMKRKELEELDFYKTTKSLQTKPRESQHMWKFHLKIRHTREACDFRPCQSAFSCGFLLKHNNLKSRRASLVKFMSQLESKLTTANKDVANARAAVEKVQKLILEKIKDLLLGEQPHRYAMNRLRNWLQLNVMSLLCTLVIDSYRI